MRSVFDRNVVMRHTAVLSVSSTRRNTKRKGSDLQAVFTLVISKPGQTALIIHWKGGQAGSELPLPAIKPAFIRYQDLYNKPIHI